MRAETKLSTANRNRSLAARLLGGASLATVMLVAVDAQAQTRAAAASAPVEVEVEVEIIVT